MMEPRIDPESLCERIFNDALERDAASRSSFLEEACGDDQELLHSIQMLLDAHDRSCDVLGPDLIADSARPFGPYLILEELGRGGQGSVYRARDSRLGREVALKLLPIFVGAADPARERFQREAEVISRLEDPGICTVYESGEVEQVPYIAMQFLGGRTLAQILRAGEDNGSVTPGSFSLASGVTSGPGFSSHSRDSINQVLRLFERLARSLHAAHEAGLVHRDVKPGNIMVTEDGAPVLLDFGLARDIDSEGDTLTRTGDMLGTPHYMSPEQILGAVVDRRSDVFSLAVCLFECLARRRPFEAPTRESLFRSITTDPVPSLSTTGSGVPRDLEIVLATALEREPGRRYQTALNFAEELQRVLEWRPIQAKPASSLYKLRRWAQRNPGVAISTTVTFFVLAVALAVSLALLSMKDTELQRRRALALANAAANAMEANQYLGLVLALEAVRTDSTPETVSQLHSAVSRSLERARVEEPGAFLVCVAFSPSGDRFLAVATTGVARLWSLDGTPFSPPLRHGGPLRCGACDPRGEIAVTGSAAGSVVFWDLSDRTQPNVLATHQAGTSIEDLQVSPDGEWFLASCTGQDPTIWDRRGVEVTRLRGHADHVVYAAFSADSTRIATCSWDRTVRVWERQGTKWNLVTVLEGHVDRPKYAEFSPRGDLILTSVTREHRLLKGESEHDVLLWDMDGTLVTRLSGHTGPVSKATFSPQGDAVLTASIDGTVRLWNFDGTDEIVYKESLGHFTDVDFLGTGGWVIAATQWGRVYILDEAGAVVHELAGHETRVWSFDHLSDGSQVVTGSIDGSARVWELKSKEAPVFRATRPGARLSDDGKLVVTGGDVLRIWSARGEIVKTLRRPAGKGRFRAQKFLTGSRTVAALVGTELWLHAMDDNTTQRIPLEHLQEIRPITQFSPMPDGQSFLVCPDSAMVATLFDRAGETIMTYSSGSQLTGARLSRDGKHAILSSYDGRAYLFDTEGEGEPRVIYDHGIPLTRADVSPQGDRVLTAGSDGSARLWDLEGRLLYEMDAHQQAVFGVDFSPDGSCIVLSSGDKSATVWDSQGHLLYRLKGHLSVVGTAVFTPDGKRILTSSLDGTARFWFVEVEDLLRSAVARSYRSLSPVERRKYVDLLGQ